MSSPNESGDLTTESSSPENTEVLTPSRTATKTKKCSYCWIEVQWQGHFQHEKACAKKFAKPSRRSSAGQSKVSTPISDEKKGNYRKCPHCDEMKHARSLKAHVEKCEKYRKFVKNGTDCVICSRSFELTTALYQHLSHTHKNDLLEFGKEGSESVEQNETMEPNESMDQNDALEQSEENITEENVKKAKCDSCTDMIHVGSMKRHTMSCPTYQKLIRNGSECIVCSRQFESRKMLYSHIGKIHKAALVELKKGSKQNKEQNASRDQGSLDQNDSMEQDLIIDENESMEQNDTVDEREDNVGKITKNRCKYCFETYHKDFIKRHSNRCGLYQKFVRNGSECSVCMKTFESRKELNEHIGRRHKKELNEITKSEGQTESEASNSDNICKNCSESFTLAIELKQHEKNCQSDVVGIEMIRTPKELSPRESFDKQTDFGHDEATTDIISGDTNPGDNDEAMDEEVMEDTIEETLEENDVVLDGLNNDTIKETLEENNVNNDSIVMNECKYCEDAIPNKRFKAHADQCKNSTKYVNKRLNACIICKRKFSSKRDVFLHVQKKHSVNIGGNPNSDEIDISGEEVEQNGIENQARMDQDGLSNVVISSGTSLQNQINLINPRTTLNPNLGNPDMARMLVKRDPNTLPLMELNPNFQNIRPTEEIDSRIITHLYMCPICLGKLVDPMHGADHITRFHRIRYVDQMRLGLKLTEVPV